ncbi:Beta-D-glucosyl crocetin beta-1,6-glucosyltransferase [Sesamum angolense]|uniref:Beta-D-glucosyl crocetin beta-1,6-glucosyltransferase n=1 Tax=Sesamum angolense TaxID=2727404 RepID=A0AAE1XGW8_9LAMI|nr:Beta-D-glucosyl crocetin beta-1,6-glucosyltransferase [Sesamum angolense]
MGSLATEQKTIHVLMFPWLAHGHISPYLELAKRLTKRDFIIHLCSTPANLSSIKHKIGEKFALSIRLVELHLPSLPNLPPATTPPMASHRT